MARLQALPLPPEGAPFMLVIDDADEFFDVSDMTETVCQMRTQSGARFIFVTSERVDVVT
ncbi:hypothetical protein OG436_29320 [Streptomyces caniferus]|uniref:hypothetical protein n=1 Tax=Streptomyces caniferus TaxID=285557 RepID=UPI002E2D43FC|nr:hypothetical protein [Streptomyces caniferus]